MKDKIFISYRRDDAAAFAALLNARLTEKFGTDRVFIDVDSIGPGVDFIDSITKAVSSSSIMLAVIGRRWNPERLHNPRDLVRLEIAAAIKQGIWIIPILLEEVEMPRQEELPEELAPLTRRNAAEISTPRMNRDIRRLIEEIEQIFTKPAEIGRKKGPSSPGASQPVHPQPSPRPATPKISRVSAAAAPAVVPSASNTDRMPWKKAVLISIAILALASLVAIPASRKLLFPEKHSSGPELDTTEETADDGLVVSVVGMSVRARAFSEKHLRERGLPDLDSGLEVVEVFPDGPAERAGVTKGDVVRKLDERLLKNAADFVAEIRKRRPGQSVALEVWSGARFRDVSVPVENGFALYKRHCDSGRLAGCYYLASLYEFDTKDLARAAALYRSACDDNYFRACTGLGGLYDSGKGLVKDPVRAATLYQRACDGKDGEACNELGDLFKGGIGIDKDLPRAVAFYQRGCSLQALRGCVQLGRLSESGSGTEKNAARAALYYEQACDAGDAEGCLRLGYLTSAGEGVSKDLSRAAKLYQVACDGGDFYGCSSLGFSYENGYGVELDPARAASLYEQVCEAEFGYGCYALGILFRDGKGVKKDPKRGAGLLQRGCDLGWQDSCNALALLYKDGNGVSKDMSRAISLLRAACDRGSASACNNLGVQYVRGEALEKDVTRGAVLYQRACDGNVAVACSNLGFLYEQGNGVPKDSAKALVLFRQACGRGITQACESVKRLGKVAEVDG